MNSSGQGQENRTASGQRPPTVLGQPVTLFETHVELATPAGISKAISYQAFYDILSTALSAESNVKKTTYILPANCYLLSSSGVEMEVSCYYPGRVREVKFSNGDGSTPYSIVFPNIIIHHLLKRNGDKWHLAVSYYYATSLNINALPLTHIQPGNRPKDVWPLPLPNMFTDGKMCYGKNSLIINFEENLRGLDWYYRLLTDSPFNSDLMVPSLRNSVSPREWIELLAERVSEDPSCSFPYELLKV